MHTIVWQYLPKDAGAYRSGNGEGGSKRDTRSARGMDRRRGGREGPGVCERALALIGRTAPTRNSAARIFTGGGRGGGEVIPQIQPRHREATVRWPWRSRAAGAEQAALDCFASLAMTGEGGRCCLISAKSTSVIPAKAGIHVSCCGMTRSPWTPAFAGVTLRVGCGVKMHTRRRSLSPLVSFLKTPDLP